MAPIWKLFYPYSLCLAFYYLEVTLAGPHLWHSCCISKSGVLGVNGKQAETGRIHLPVLLEPSSAENSKTATVFWLIQFGSCFLLADNSRACFWDCSDHSNTHLTSIVSDWTADLERCSVGEPVPSHSLIWGPLMHLQLLLDFSWSNGCSDLLSVGTLRQGPSELVSTFECIGLRRAIFHPFCSKSVKFQAVCGSAYSFEPLTC